MRALVAAALLLLPSQALAWDGPWAIRRDAEVSPEIRLTLGTVLPAATSPAEVNALSFGLSGGTGYVDDDKSARLVVASVAGYSVWRDQRERYEPSSNATIGLFDLEVQLRLPARPRLHVLYGAALLRSGARAHARAAGLGLHLGLALPLLGEGSSMRAYRRGFLQVEARPVVLSLLDFLDLEGSTDREIPQVGVGGEVALVGGLRTRGGVLAGDLRFTSSYVHGSFYLLAALQYEGPVLFWRIAPTATVRYTWPGRPLRRHLSEAAQRLVYGHHVAVTVGLSLRL